MTRDRTLIIVDYHSAALTRRAIESARAASALPLQVVVVDNSGDPAESEALETSGADLVVDAPDNPGYGEGANRGAAAADGDVLIVANPDVVFAPGSIDLLAGHLADARVAMSGPRFVWDEGGAWLLPPPDFPTRGSEIGRMLAGRAASWRARWLRRRREERVRFWRLESPARVDALSGAVLCVRRAAFDAVGGFDRGFRLYFEEIDLMARLRARGDALLHVPAARCQHLYNQSAGRTTTAARRYVESELRFLSKTYGERFARWALSRRFPLGAAARFEDRSAARLLSLPPGAWLVEASPAEEFATAAGTFVTGGEVRVPDDVLRSLQGDELFLMATDLATGRAGPAVRVGKSA